MYLRERLGELTNPLLLGVIALNTSRKNLKHTEALYLVSGDTMVNVTLYMFLPKTNSTYSMTNQTLISLKNTCNYFNNT